MAPVLDTLLLKVAQRGLLKQATAVLRTLIREHDARVQARKSRGRASTSRGSKVKGREGVERARAWILTLFRVLQDDDLLIQTTSVGGSDIHPSPLGKHVFPFAVESKRVEKLNVWDALHQARVNADKRGLKPVLFFSRANGPLYVVFDAQDLSQWLREHGMEIVANTKAQEANVGDF